MMPLNHFRFNYLGGTRAPFILDWEMWDSWPKTKAECLNPDSCRYRYTRKFNSSVVYDMLTLNLLFYSPLFNWLVWSRLPRRFTKSQVFEWLKCSTFDSQNLKQFIFQRRSVCYEDANDLRWPYLINKDGYIDVNLICTVQLKDLQNYKTNIYSI